MTTKQPIRISKDFTRAIDELYTALGIGSNPLVSSFLLHWPDRRVRHAFYDAARNTM